MSIKDKFGDISAKYESQRRQIVPCMDEYYGIPLQVLDFACDSPRVLDLGCGSGLFTAFLLTKYPKARVTLVDLSDKMLAVAKERFAAHKYFEYVESDFARLCVTGTFDIIISGLAIHHIPGPDKERLYQRCFELLKVGGVFINSDQIKGPTKELDDLSMRLWREFIETHGLPRVEIEAAYERMKFDQPSTVEEQLAWLREAGFSNVDCLFKWLPLAVFYAKR